MPVLGADRAVPATSARVDPDVTWPLLRERLARLLRLVWLALIAAIPPAVRPLGGRYRVEPLPSDLTRDALRR